MLPASPSWYCSRVSDSNESGIYVFGARQTVFIYDISDKSHGPRICGQFTSNRDRVNALSMCHVPGHLSLCVSGADSGRVMVFDTGTRVVTAEHAMHKAKITAVSWSPLQKDLIMSADEKGGVVCWQYASNDVQQFTPDAAHIFAMTCSPSFTSIVAIGYKSGSIMIIDVFKRGLVLNKLRGHDEEIHSLVWSCPPSQSQPMGDNSETRGDIDMSANSDLQKANGDGYLLASGSRDRTIRLWNADQGKQIKRLRLPANKRDRYEDQSRARVWLSLCWPSTGQMNLVSSSLGGDLLMWDLCSSAKHNWEVFGISAAGGHNRIIFNIAAGNPGYNTLVTISMDRQIILWDLPSFTSSHTIATLGGFVYAMKVSPVDPGRMAMGIGDSMIRVWNRSSSRTPFDVAVLWQGVKAKVTALSWHPEKEGILAYGTDDGRVGIYDVLNTRPPNVSSTYHKRTVYVICWGPPCSNAEPDSSSYVVYSVGDGIVLQHDPHQLKLDAVNIHKIIQETNGKTEKFPIRSEVSWKPDYSLVLLGNDDGSIEVYRPPNLRLLAVIQVHLKLVNVIQWHPMYVGAGSAVSDNHCWIATGSNESTVHVVDLKTVINQTMEQNATISINQSMRSLDGHSMRITGISWSPHVDGQLVSVSYDGTAKVWDVLSGVCRACFFGHQGRLLCVVWCPLEADTILTGGDDFCLHVWKVSENADDVEGRSDRKKRKQKGKGKSRQKPQLQNAEQDAKREEEPPVKSVDESELDVLQKMLDEKRQQLVADQQLTGQDDQPNGHNRVLGNAIEKILPSVDATGVHRAEILSDNEVINESEAERSVTVGKILGFEVQETKKTTAEKDSRSSDTVAKRKRKLKSYFPVSGTKENRGKQLVHGDILHLTRRLYGEKDVQNDDVDDSHMGFFLTRRDMYRCLRKEQEHHLNHVNMEHYLQLEIWKGNIGGALKLARDREELSDWLVAMAPMASYDAWLQVSEAYSRQLEADGQYHKAATYLLASHKIYDAIDLLKRHKLFKECLALAKLRLSPVDPVIEELYNAWAVQLNKDGNFEQAVKCHLALKQVKEAVRLLARRCDQLSLTTATHMSLLANEQQQGLICAQRVVYGHIAVRHWSEAYAMIKQHSALQPLLLITSVHELLHIELNKLMPTEFPSEPTDGALPHPPRGSHANKTELPDFMLDSNDADQVSPWQPHIVGNKSFMHHVLSVWYGQLNVCLDGGHVSEMYETVSGLLTGRQSHADLQQLLIEIGGDVTLCLLSLLMADTSSAIDHLLRAVASLHEANDIPFLQALCRICLPQGPKYILKLQHEVTAMMVVITIDSHSSWSSSPKVHSFRRYLSNLGEDNSVSNGSLHCRELDCLRAFYYLGVLHYLRTAFQVEKKRDEDVNARSLEDPPAVDPGSNEEGTEDEPEQPRLAHKISVEILPDLLIEETTEKPNVIDDVDALSGNVFDDMALTAKTADSVNSGIGHQTSTNDSAYTVHSNSADSVSVDNIPRLNDSDSVQTNSQPTCESQEDVCTQISSSVDESFGESVYVNVDSVVTDSGASNIKKISTCRDQTGDNDAIVSSVTDVNVTDNSKASLTSTNLVSNSDFQCTIMTLTRLAKGVLWDVQAKHYALKETLGYIHNAISKLLLDQKEKSTNEDVSSRKSPPRTSSTWS